MVKTLISAYFDIVRKTIQDIVPKAVSESLTSQVWS